MDAATQKQLFERAIELFHQKKFTEARPLFEQASAGPVREMAHSARTHARICEQKTAPPPDGPRTAEEHYVYGVALLNQRRLEEAELHLKRAAEMSPHSDYVHYAYALARGLRGDIEASAESLRRAIRLNPLCRNQAQRDPDYEPLRSHPLIATVLSETGEAV